MAAIVFTWLPEKLNLLEGMALGAGFGAAFSGTLGLTLKKLGKSIELESLITAGTIGGVVIGAFIVGAGNLKFI